MSDTTIRISTHELYLLVRHPLVTEAVLAGLLTLNGIPLLTPEHTNHVQ